MRPNTRKEQFNQLTKTIMDKITLFNTDYGKAYEMLNHLLKMQREGLYIEDGTYTPLEELVKQSVGLISSFDKLINQYSEIVVSYDGDDLPDMAAKIERMNRSLTELFDVEHKLGNVNCLMSAFHDSVQAKFRLNQKGWNGISIFEPRADDDDMAGDEAELCHGTAP